MRNILEFYLTITIPLLYLTNVFLIQYYKNTFQLPYLLILLGLSLSVIGLIFWLTSFFTLLRSGSFGVLPQKQVRIKTGLYKFLKHPMYIGISLVFFGLSLANQSKEGLLFTIAIMLPLLIIRAILEDKKLYEK